MNKLPLLLAVGLVALALPTPTLAGIQVRINLGLPNILPPLVEVQPGVRVVQDYDEGIFFVSGYYWTQREGNWYRARDHRRAWRYVTPDRIPSTLASHRPGTYRHYRRDEGDRGRYEDNRGRGRQDRPWSNARDFGRSEGHGNHRR